MRCHWLYLLMISGCLLVARTGRAQKAAIPPITPRAPSVQRLLPHIQQALSQPSGQPAPPSALVARPAPVVPGPLVILNSTTIISTQLSGISPQDIKSLAVYNGVDVPREWRSLATYGIIDITLKKKHHLQLKTRTLAEIGDLLGVEGPVGYSVNGMPVAEPTLRIAADAIGEIKVTHATAAAPITLVNVLIARPIPPPQPPGTIRIRGVASSN
jgi:hypothetical protein